MKLNKTKMLCIAGLTAIAFSACSDPDDEIKSLNFNRNFSPIGTESSEVKETTAVISWTAAAGATSYNLEIFADDSLTFAGTPEKTLTGITETTTTLTGLLFDTEYSVRIQAVTDDNDARTSKWNTGVYFKTSAMQFMKNPKPADIADRSVTINWEAEDGYDVTEIVIGDIRHSITDEEKAAGKATIEGLQPETSYTAYLYYNGKQCGKRDFTTIADLEGAILVHEGDDLKSLIENAVGGEVLALYGGKYALNANTEVDEETGEELGTTYGAVKVNASITIKGIYPTDQPTLLGRFEIYNGAALTVSQVVINATQNSTTDQIFNFKTAEVNYGALDIQNCEIKGKADGKGLVYLNVKSTVESITINNCLVHGIECNGGDFIDSRAGLPRQITLTNSTFYTVATSRDFIRIDDASGSFAGEAAPVVKVDHCTLYGIGAGASNNRVLYARYKGNDLTFTNNIVVGTKYKRGLANGTLKEGETAATAGVPDPEPVLSGNFYWDCLNITAPSASADSGISWFDTDDQPALIAAGLTEDTAAKKAKGNGVALSATPFTDDVPDFTVDANSAAFKAGAGDPRWLK